MIDEVEGGVAETPENEPAGNLEPDNLNVLDAVANRLKEQETQEEEPKTEQPEEEVEETEEPEGEQVQPEETEEDEAPDEIAEELADLTDEESEWIKANPQSRLAKRIGKLVRQRKEAEEKAAEVETRLKAKLESDQSKPQQEAQPFQAKPPADNPFKGLKTPEELEEKHGELTNFIDWAEDLLDEHEDALSDDVVYTEGENEFTKKQVRQRLRQVRKEKDTFLPARYRDLQEVAQRKKEEEHFSGVAREQLSWMTDEESEGYKQLNDIKNDPVFEEIRKRVPQVAPRLEFILGHAVNSILQTQTEAKPPKIKPAKPKPPTSPSGNAAVPARGANTSQEKTLEKLQARYEQTGSSEDLVALRTYKHQKGI
jgi:hypothetical protein